MASFGLDIGEWRGAKQRSIGLLALGWACVETALAGRDEHHPTDVAYPENVLRRVSFEAGGDLGWRISALTTPRSRPAPWKIVVVTGAPSWAEYWAPVMAALPADREMIVVDRPGYGLSEPDQAVTDIRVQAMALSPLLTAAPGQNILLVGQSYGAAISVLMAAAQPSAVGGLALLSSYLGESGPTARWLVDTGVWLKGVIPRDLKTAVTEVSGQAEQLAPVCEALTSLDVPIHMIHGDADDFAPVALARKLAESTPSRRPIQFHVASGAGHFLTDGPPELLIERLETCLPQPEPDGLERARAWIERLGRRLQPPALSKAA
ncbi:MAG TPA: alpha/beta hydrolase [Caulobacteraceae bacterium]